MIPATRQRLMMLSPAIKCEWTALLRGEPALTPLGRPETLVFMMDATLVQLFAGLREGSHQRWLRPCAPVVASIHSYCPCGLNPLLKYFTTGELALRAAAGPALGPAIEEALERFRRLARHEVAAICSVCQHRGLAAGCPAGAPRSAGR